MELGTHTALPDVPPDDQKQEVTPNRVARLRQWVELVSSVVLALATVATAWCGYQSARWNGEQSRFVAEASTATIRAAKFNNLAEQRLSLHVALFGQWALALNAGDDRLADFILARFPEPLRGAAAAWQATQPLINAAAPASPFDMPQYALNEQAEALRWEAVADQAGQSANRASETSDRYLLFTIIFASALFFAGISGKFYWQAVDLTTLVLGALVLIVGLVVVFSTPVM